MGPMHLNPANDRWIRIAVPADRLPSPLEFCATPPEHAEVASLFLFNLDHFFPYSGDPDGKRFEALTMLASLAEVTEHIELGEAPSRASGTAIPTCWPTWLGR